MPEAYVFSGPEEFTSLPADTNTKTFQASVFPRTLFRIPNPNFRWSGTNAFLKSFPEVSERIAKHHHCCLLNPQADAMTCCSYNRTKAERLLNGLRPWQSIYWGHRCSIQMMMIPNQFHQRYCCYSMHFSLLDVEGGPKEGKETQAFILLAAACCCPGWRDEIGMTFLTWWMAPTVAKTTAKLPHRVDTWNCPGIGRFLNILSITHLTTKCQNEILTDVVISLQISTAHAFQFYHSCEFKQINWKKEITENCCPSCFAIWPGQCILPMVNPGFDCLRKWFCKDYRWFEQTQVIPCPWGCLINPMYDRYKQLISGIGNLLIVGYIVDIMFWGYFSQFSIWTFIWNQWMLKV